MEGPQGNMGEKTKEKVKDERKKRLWSLENRDESWSACYALL